MKTRTKWITSGITVVVIAAMAFTAIWFADSRRFVDVESFAANRGGYEIVTSKLCVKGVDCTDAVITDDKITLLKFSSRDAAKKAIQKLGSTGIYQSDYVLADFSKTQISEEQQNWVKQGLDGLNTSH